MVNSPYKTENDLKWIQVQDALDRSLRASMEQKSFVAMSRLQEAEIVLRSIIDLEQIEKNRLK